MLKIRNFHAKDRLWLKLIANRFTKYIDEFKDLFRAGNHRLDNHALNYAKGLIQAPNSKRNIERMEESVQGMSYDPVQGFISDSTWKHEPVHKEISKIADDMFQGHSDTCLLIDETGIEKKGSQSAGVARQHNGRLGKVDNCQVGVFSALCSGSEVIPIGAKLFLPESWTDDKERCNRAKIPEEQQVYKTKPELAKDLVDESIMNNIHFQWVIADGLYGNSPGFSRFLDDKSISFVVDIHCDQHVYTEDPSPKIPVPSNTLGRKPTRYQTDTASIQVDKLVSSQAQESWTTLKIRDTAKGKLVVEALCLNVWVWDGEESTAREWKLIVTRDSKTKKEVKYSLSNAGKEISLKRLAYLQHQRYWIEDSFKSAKSICGLADYQVRSWISWHHHVAMVMLTCLFMAKEKRAAPENCSLLSGNDIREMLTHFLPQRKNDPEEILQQVEIRHEKRRRDIEFAYRKQAQKMGAGG